MNYLYMITGAANSGLGIGHIIRGAFDTVGGDFRRGMNRLWLGMLHMEGAIPVTGRAALTGLSLMGAALGAAARGASNCAKGWRERDMDRLTTGLMQVGMAKGIVDFGTTHLKGVADERIATIQHAAFTALSSGLVVHSGIQDFARGHYLKGAGKALAGFACSGLYAYCTIQAG